jgi:hypothetical protein
MPSGSFGNPVMATFPASMSDRLPVETSKKW